MVDGRFSGIRWLQGIMIQLEKPGLLVHATKLEPRAWITLESLDWRSLADHLIFGVYGMYVSQKGFLAQRKATGNLFVGDATRSTRFHKSLHTLPQSSCNVFPDAPGHINIRYMHHLHGMPIVPEEHYLPAAHNSKCINLSLCHRLTQ